MVLHTSRLNWGFNLLRVCVHCAIYETHLVSWFCRDLCLIGGWRGSISHGYICIVLYIYRCAKFGVAVFKASMLNWGVGVNLLWVYVHCSIYIYRYVIRCAKFGVVVFKVCMLDRGRGGGKSAIGICALCYIYLPVDLPSLV